MKKSALEPSALAPAQAVTAEQRTATACHQSRARKKLFCTGRKSGPQPAAIAPDTVISARIQDLIRGEQRIFPEGLIMIRTFQRLAITGPEPDWRTWMRHEFAGLT